MLSKILTIITVYICGASILSVELIAIHIVTPYFGNSSIVWTNMIGIFILALSIGYTYGGKLADKYPSNKLFFMIPFLASLLLLIPYFLLDYVTNLYFAFIPSDLNANVSIFSGSIFLSMICFILPILLLGMMSPFAIRLLTSSLDSLGLRSGSIYAISTVGSLSGILMTTFYLIPHLGSHMSFIYFVILLFIVSLMGLIWEKIS